MHFIEIQLQYRKEASKQTSNEQDQTKYSQVCSLQTFLSANYVPTTVPQTVFATIISSHIEKFQPEGPDKGWIYSGRRDRGRVVQVSIGINC